MTAIIAFPSTRATFARLTLRQRDRNVAEEQAETRALIDLAKRIIDDPRGYTDAQLREVCGAYMDIPQEAGGGGVHYLRADQHIFAINRREKIARNRAAFAAQQAALAAEADETPIRIAMQHRRQWPQIVGWGVVGAVVLLGGTGWL